MTTAYRCHGVGNQGHTECRVGQNHLVCDERVVADPYAAVGADDRSHDCAEVADRHLGFRPQIEERAIIETGIVSRTNADWSPAAVVSEGVCRIQPGSL